MVILPRLMCANALCKLCRAGDESSDDTSGQHAYGCADCSPGALAAQESVAFPSRCGDRCSRTGADAGANERVAQAMPVLAEFHAADFCFLNGLLALRLSIGDGCLREADEGSGLASGFGWN